MSESSQNEDHRLSDEDYLQFLSRGYVTLPSSLSADYHHARYQDDVLYGRLRADTIDRTMSFRSLGSDDSALREEVLNRSVETLGIADLKREYLTVGKGTIVLSHYDTSHRCSRRSQDADDRFMYKFHFLRTKEPVKAAWWHRSTPNLSGVRDNLKPVVSRLCSWSCGESIQSPLEESARREAKTVLFHGQEDEEVWAAYQLAREASKESVGILASALQDPMESTRRAAAFGLLLEALRCREVTSKLETVLLTTLLRYRWNPVSLID